MIRFSTNTSSLIYQLISSKYFALVLIFLSELYILLEYTFFSLFLAILDNIFSTFVTFSNFILFCSLFISFIFI
ncbi:MAG: hypothetical protein Q8S84_07560 [bacterium]|nr:hypothetical protein [bacterium]